MSLYVKLSRPHRHNGKLCRAGDKLRIPTATALAMTKDGRATLVEGQMLVEAKAEEKSKKRARKAKAKAKDSK